MSNHTIVVTAVNDVTGESEDVTLTETGANTGVFTGTVGTTFGTTAGTVQEINIRATTIENWDRQLMIVPNRKFITGSRSSVRPHMCRRTMTSGRADLMSSTTRR